MLANKRPFIAGLLLAPFISVGLFGGLGAAQTSAGNNTLATYLKPNDSSTVQTDLAGQPNCQNRIMQVVAHEDDDILFMNPDLSASLKNGDCVKTIYMTAGDAGLDSQYWLQRQQGAESAYSNMLGLPLDWHTSQVKAGDRFLLSVATASQAPNVSLVFVGLPDGNLHGEGFAATGYQSLQKLEDGQLDHLTTVDGQNSYTIDDLTTLLAGLISQYQPDQIRTQANDNPDHSDHIAVGRLVADAYKAYTSQNIPIKSTSVSFYMGYAVADLPMNVFGDQLAQKQLSFLSYAQFDSAVCHSLDDCNNGSAYGSYLTRQYQDNPSN